MSSKFLATLVLLATATLPTTAAASTDSKTWQFDVLLDGKPIGYHRFDLSLDGSNRVLESKASFDVKFLFINAFSYRHHSTEVWNDGCLQSIDAMTDSNGNQLAVRGRSDEKHFRLLRPADGALTECVQTFAYWNPAVLDSTKLLNSQTGAYEDVAIYFNGREAVRVDGTQVEADQYRIETRKGDITLWYSAANQTWLALEAPAKGGRTLRYQPTRLPLPVPLAENDPVPVNPGS